MVEPTSHDSERTSRWFLWGFVALGLVFIGMSIVGGGEQVRFVVGTTRTSDGVVIGHDAGRRDHWDRPRRTVRLVVRYEADGHPHDLKSRVGYQPTEHPIGDRVPVVYRAGRPASGQIDTFTERWGQVPAFCGVGLVMA